MNPVVEPSHRGKKRLIWIPIVIVALVLAWLIAVVGAFVLLRFNIALLTAVAAVAVVMAAYVFWQIGHRGK